MPLPPRVSPILQKGINGLKNLNWPTPPRNIFIAKKDYDPRVLDATRYFIQHVKDTYNCNVFVDKLTSHQIGGVGVNTVDNAQLGKYIDLIVTFGGDGTILHAATRFMNEKSIMPPILSISMGTLGFLLPFAFNEAREAFDDVYNGRSLVMSRSRLEVRMGTTYQALNDITFHRGSSPHLAQIDIRVNGDFLTTAIADGLTIATPTGSTAYSLSAGGSIVHPSVDSILVTPICPRSLSFRPLIFPPDAQISIQLGENSRGPTEMSMDGFDMGQLKMNEKVNVAQSTTGQVWCVTRNKDDWVHHINGLLRFNSKFGKLE